MAVVTFYVEDSSSVTINHHPHPLFTDGAVRLVVRSGGDHLVSDLLILQCTSQERATRLAEELGVNVQT